MHVEVWSDVVCPWCYIGKRRLEQALADAGIDATITHRAFQLDPSAVSDGERTIDRLAQKYGVSPAEAEAMMANVSQVAQGVGLHYRLGDTTSGNTVDAHRLILWAQEQGQEQGQALLEALYDAYFAQARPVFTVDELMPIVERAGLDAAAARAMLTSDAYREQVEADQGLARDFGANGVPFFVFDRRYGISGAQPAEVFATTIAKAREDADAGEGRA